MAEKMTFLPKSEILSLEELETICAAFIARGVRKIRLTGGEPLVRRDILRLVRSLGDCLDRGELEELTLTTNGVLLEKYARDLKAAGIKRINVSLDSLDADVFARLTRRNVLGQVLRGMDAARNAGLHIKINTVALRNVNETEIPSILTWAHGHHMDMTLIEVMPMGEIDADRVDQYVPLTEIREGLEKKYTLLDTLLRTGGPSRYVRVRETGGLLGFITPLTNNFCAGCNRVRVTCTGRIYMCLGRDDHLDLREAVRSENPGRVIHAALDKAMIAKPQAHDFSIRERKAQPATRRHMSVTGG